MEAKGQRFHTFVIEQLSEHAVDDWDWNQHDIPHVPFVHGDWSLTPAVIDNDVVVGVVLQKLFGVRVPVVLTHYHHSPTQRVFMTSLGPLTMVNGVELIARGSGTLARTTYSLGGRPAFLPLARAAEWYLRRNYVKLSEEDGRMMERRSALRRWGFNFVAGEEVRNYVRSTDISPDLVIPPVVADASSARVALNDGKPEWFVGRDDHMGLRIVRSGDVVQAFPRLCMHQGASLDGAQVTARGLQCPWHGRLTKAVATFDLAREPEAVRETPRHRLALRGPELTIEFLAQPEAARPVPLNTPPTRLAS